MAHIVYISGPMRNRPLFNFPAFDAAAIRLRELGHVPVNPTDGDKERGFSPWSLPKDYDWSQYPDFTNLKEVVAADLEMILRCDAIYLLEGWEESIGARAEKAVAEWLGHKVFYQDVPLA